MKKIRDIVLCMMISLGFWGFLYPEFTFIEDTMQIVTEAGREVMTETWEDNGIFYRILEAEPGQVRVKSRILEVLGGK